MRVGVVKQLLYDNNATTPVSILQNTTPTCTVKLQNQNLHPVPILLFTEIIIHHHFYYHFITPSVL